MITEMPQRVLRWFSAAAIAGNEYSVDPILLLAICDRESRGGDALTPPGPQGLGDNKHGHGLMQIDDRTWAAWIGSGEWVEPEKNILFGAKILAENMRRFADAFDTEFCSVAAYNCGPGNVRNAIRAAGSEATDDLKREAIDRRTTGGNYASAVLAHRDIWKQATQPTETA